MTTTKRTRNLIAATWSHFLDRKASRMGAAVSYYAVFSIAPLCVIVIRIAGLFVGSGSTQRSITNYINTTFGTSAGSFVAQLIDNAHLHSLGLASTLVGGVTLIITAIGVLSELDSDMDELWRADEHDRGRKRRRSGTIVSYIRRKAVAASVIPIIGILLIGSTLLTNVIGLFGGHIAPYLQMLDAVVSFGLGTLLFAVIFKILPDTKLPNRELLLGGVVTATLFLFGKVLIGVYVDTLADAAAFGAAGSLVVFLIWIYYSAQVFFLGASFTYVYSKEHGFLGNKLA